MTDDRLREVFGKLSPEDQAEYLAQIGAYGQAGIFVDTHGRARVLTQEALIERQREHAAAASTDPVWAEKLRRGEV